MGHILSSVPELRDVRFRNLTKGRPVKVEKALRVDDGNIILKFPDGQYMVVGSGGRVINDNYSVMNYSTKAVLNGLVRMDLLTRAQVKEHLANVEKHKHSQNRRHNIATLKRVCKDLGIPAPEVSDD